MLLHRDITISSPLKGEMYIDFLFNEDDLHLIIGLSGQALKKAFSITSINNNYMLQVPLQGPIKKPQLDLAKAAPRLSALVAQSQGGSEGKILGTFFDVATDLIGSEKTPPPTTNPLPWEGMIEENTGESGEKDNLQQLPLHDINPSSVNRTMKIDAKFDGFATTT